MSMDRCNDCSRLVDTDIDCDCYSQPMPSDVDDAEIQLDFCRCEPCRMEIYDKAQDHLDRGDAMAAQAEEASHG